MEWIVACDQPFDEVEKKEFNRMISYARHPQPSIKLPSREGIRRRVMKMGEVTVDGIRKMFSVRHTYPLVLSLSMITCIIQELEGKIALSLDAWTSSNQHAFLAIVAHYVTNDGQLGIIWFLFVLRPTDSDTPASFSVEELLIDFRELVGEHSGENMAQAVWETLQLYDLIGRVSLSSVSPISIR
jgi:hypothetical protein